MQFGIISLFPQMFSSITNNGVVGRAIKNGLLSIYICNPRDFTNDYRGTIDDHPYGGGSGMLMMVKPLRSAIHRTKEIIGNNSKVIYLSPQGKLINQELIYKLSNESSMILVCGRYKGIDERIIISEIDEELSIGNYIISGGELAAMVVIDAISRLIPNVLSNNVSLLEDSFYNGLLDCPHYTRPYIVDKQKVPDILLNGNHFEIQKWRLKYSLGKTWLKRPDLLKTLSLNKEQLSLLSEFQIENNIKNNN